MYRPEGWVNPKDNGLCLVLEIEAFEAGADAMLEGLKKDSVPPEVYADFLRWGFERGNFRAERGTPSTYYGKKGTLVFIPKEE